MSRNSKLGPFLIDEQPLPDSLTLGEFEMDKAVAGLIVRCARLESIIERNRNQAADSMRIHLLALLDVADALDRVVGPARTAPGSAAADYSLVASIEATSRLLKSRLAAVGVVPMELVGKTANPATADIVETEAHSDLPDEIVLRMITTGYWWGTAVLRRAAVAVASGQHE